MKKTTFICPLFALMFNLALAQQPGQVKILFDCTKAETAGNADWVVDADLHNLTWNPNASTGSSYTKSNPQQIPTPAQSAIVSSTPETYWEGALSYWGIDCVNKGYWVETLPPITGQITYGNLSNAQDLSKYNIYIVDEPNIVYTAAEKTAIMNFVQNGGSLFMISDHQNSDRNNDGWDSPNIWNDFITNNPVQNNAFGIHFALENFSGISTNVTGVATDSMIHGPFGNVTEVQWSNGTCMNIKPSENPSVKACIWKSGMGQLDTAVLCSYARWGCGKVAAIGDSSPPDDGSGNPVSSLYTGYTGDANGNHRPWLMNMTIWLAEAACPNTANIITKTETTRMDIYPNPSKDQALICFSTNQDMPPMLTVTDIAGKSVTVSKKFHRDNLSDVYTIETNNLSEGIYFCTLTFADKSVTKKLFVTK